MHRFSKYTVAQFFKSASSYSTAVAVILFTYASLATPVAFAQAEISVSSFNPAAEITSGDTTPSVDDGTDFGDFLPGRTTVETFIITNSGDQPLVLGGAALSFSGPGAARYNQVSPFFPDSLAPGDQTSLRILYTPAQSPTEQIVNAGVNIASNDSDENPFTFAIRATTSAPTGPPNLVVRKRSEVGGPPAIDIPNGDSNPTLEKKTDFGEGLLNVTLSEDNLQLANSGGDALNLSSTPLTFSGPHASDFTARLSSDDQIAVSGSTRLTLSFKPTEPGLRTAIVSVASDDPDDNPYTFAIQGTGIAPPPVASVEIVEGNNQSVETLERFDRLQVRVIDADDQIIPGVDVTFTAPSSGASLRTVSSVRTTNSSGLATLTAPVANDIAGEFTVVASAESLEANFSLESTAPPVTPPEINLAGNTPLNFEASNVYNFGFLRLGETDFETFFIQNLGTEELTLGPNPVSITGPNASEFRLLAQPRDEVVPGRSNTTFVVYYEPTGSGEKTATLTINNDDADESPLVFTLKARTAEATGSADIEVRNGSTPIPIGDVTPSLGERTDFEMVAVNGSKTVQDFQIFNTGGDVLIVGENGITVTGDNADDFAVFESGGNGGVSLDSIPPASRYSFQILFSPQGPGLRTATVSIANNAEGKSPYNFAVSGQGIVDLEANSGSGQSAAISAGFAQPLVVKAIDDDGEPVEGVEVTFAAPTSGASAVFPAVTVLTNAQGLASTLATANAVIGSYTVSASSLGSNAVSFALSNEPDRDNDGVADMADNCPDTGNADQSDVDGDLLGDVCDSDADNDLVDNENDNCPLVPNPDQADANPNTPEGDVCELPDEELCLPIKARNDKVVVVCL